MHHVMRRFQAAGRCLAARRVAGAARARAVRQGVVPAGARALDRAHLARRAGHDEQPPDARVHVPPRDRDAAPRARGVRERERGPVARRTRAIRVRRRPRRAARDPLPALQQPVRRLRARRVCVDRRGARGCAMGVPRARRARGAVPDGAARRRVRAHRRRRAVGLLALQPQGVRARPTRAPRRARATCRRASTAATSVAADRPIAALTFFGSPKQGRRRQCWQLLKSQVGAALRSVYNVWSEDAFVAFLRAANDTAFTHLHKSCDEVLEGGAAWRPLPAFRDAALLNAGRLVISERCDEDDEREFAGLVDFVELRDIAREYRRVTRVPVGELEFAAPGAIRRFHTALRPPRPSGVPASTPPLDELWARRAEDAKAKVLPPPSPPGTMAPPAPAHVDRARLTR